jgi:hypothetical protein
MFQRLWPHDHESGATGEAAQSETVAPRSA